MPGRKPGTNAVAEDSQLYSNHITWPTNNNPTVVGKGAPGDHLEEEYTSQHSAATTAIPPNMAPVHIMLCCVPDAPAVTTTDGLAVEFLPVGVAAPVAFPVLVAGSGLVRETPPPATVTLPALGVPTATVGLAKVGFGSVTVAVLVWVKVLGSLKPASLAQSSTDSPSKQQKPATGAQYVLFSQYPKSVAQHVYDRLSVPGGGIPRWDGWKRRTWPMVGLKQNVLSAPPQFTEPLP